MSKPYAQLRAQMSPAAQAQAQARAFAVLAHATAAPAQMAYAVWYRYTYPTAPQAPDYAWQLLETSPEGRGIRAMWEAIAQAVLDAAREAQEVPHA